MPYSFFNLVNPDTHICRTHAEVAEDEHEAYLDSLTPSEHHALLEEAYPLANALCQAIARHNAEGVPLSYGAIIEALRLVRARMELEMDTPDEEDCDA